MKNLFISLVIGTASIFNSVSAVAQMGQIAISGSGCPQGDAYFDAVEDRILIHYNQMNVSNGDGRTISRAACNLRLPLTVPSGTRLVSELISSAEADVWANNKVILSQELFFVGSSEVRQEEQIQQQNGEVILSSSISTSCGPKKNVILAYNLNATLLSLSKQVDSSAIVRTSALTLRFERCLAPNFW